MSCRAWSHRCALEGRSNERGRRAAAGGVPFLHMEFSRSVRDDEYRMRRAVAALATTLP
ncbi:hypothetical protein OIE61_30165 [Streptomyces sp. NBC_01762]|uniref:hypothetical protein n=1 Tax=unclassified Streptomyces TaxID=2593676 RepID=UPI002DDC8D75|nr:MULTISPECIES: hypothetical protein [unclassified Streptomyces]WSC47887.1 hypothetical protein OIE61_30165 [Streptomyces sp. NBC_01762]WSD27538.1 hypothetical protein OHA26_30880 [Streptomyces sp. NBC_01751]